LLKTCQHECVKWTYELQGERLRASATAACVQPSHQRTDHQRCSRRPFPTSTHRAGGYHETPRAHAIRTAIDEALDAREKGEKGVILFNLSGHGLLDLSAYDQYLHNGMTNGTVSEAQLDGLAERLPKVNLPG
jgi:hypothetical protein